MGAGGSKTPVVGLPVNPRVDYADNQSKNVGKPVLIDAPVLVNMKHGTVRYRYLEEKGKSDSKNERLECPHEGPERRQKHGYFFHSRLNDFSEEASYDKEENWKFAYVYKGPERAKQKSLYYVFGKGLKTNENGFLEPKYKPQGKGFEWPDLYKVHGHLYYDLAFEEGNANDDEDDDNDDDDSNDADDLKDDVTDPISFKIDDKESLNSLKRRIAIKFIKPLGSIHIHHGNTELRHLDTKIASLRLPSEGSSQKFTIKLIPK